MRLISPISISPTQPIPGQASTVTYTVKNYGSLPAIYQNAVLQCRVNGINCDSSYTGILTINAGEEKTFTQTININSAGSYTLIPYFQQNNSWYKYDKGIADSNYIITSVH